MIYRCNTKKLNPTAEATSAFVEALQGEFNKNKNRLWGINKTVLIRQELEHDALFKCKKKFFLILTCRIQIKDQNNI